MTSNLPLRVARFLLSLLLLIPFASVARAQSAEVLTGVYNGRYICSQGATNLKLSLVASPTGDVSALFTFYLPPGTQQQGYTYSLHGDYNLKTSRVSLSPVRWETEQPAGFTMVGMNGTFDSSELSGAIYGAGCSTFNVERDQAESANIAAVISGQTDMSKLKAAAPAPAAPPVQAPTQPQESYTAAVPRQAPTGARPPVSTAPAMTPAAPPAAPKTAQTPTPAPAKDPYMAALQAQAPAGVKVPAAAAPRATPPAATPPAPATAPKPAAQAAPPKAAPTPAPATPTKTASAGIPGGPIKYLCYNTDPKQPVVYFTDIFDIPDGGSVPDNFISYELAKTDFEIYLNEKYGYVSSNPNDDHFVECGYLAVGNQKPETVTQTILAKKQALAAQAAASKKQVVSTGWKYTEKDKQASIASASSGTKPPANAAPAAPPKASAVPGVKASSAATGGVIKYLCYNTDPKQPVVYFSDIFDIPDTTSTPENFVNYQLAKTGFELYLNETYGYYSSNESDIHFVDCAYQAVGNQKPEAVVQALATKKQSLAAQAAAAKKQVASTGWKYTERDKNATAANTPGGAKALAGTQTADPVIVWHMDSTKDELTGSVSTPQPKSLRLYPANGFLVSISASCASNGVGVFFLADTGDKSPVPEYAWYIDQSDNSGEQVADVRIVVDGGSVHVAQGWPNKDGHTLYTNNLGLLFYEPNIVAHSTQQQEDNANTGILALDGLIAPYVRQAAKANAQDWADSSAGPMTTLLNAKSVRVELPITNKDIKPIIDLNPQDKVLHQFVSDCYAKFTSGRR